MLLLDCLPLKVKFRNITNSEMSSKAGGKQVKFRNVTNSEVSSKAGGKQITFNTSTTLLPHLVKPCRSAPEAEHFLSREYSVISGVAREINDEQSSQLADRDRTCPPGKTSASMND